MLTLAWQSDDGRLSLYKGTAAELLDQTEPGSVDVVIADPPYFLSGGGQTCRGGQRASVDKGAWDKAADPTQIHAFNVEWLAKARKTLKAAGTVWACGTLHNAYALGYAMQVLSFRVLNDVTWEKPNPPPNLACRTLTHSTERLIWASLGAKARHVFNYAAMRAVTGKQMKDVWRLPGVQAWETRHGRYPAQKPVLLYERMLVASAPAGEVRVLDPFAGSGSSGVAAARLGFSWCGVNSSDEAIELAVKRLKDAAALGCQTPDIAGRTNDPAHDPIADVVSALRELRYYTADDVWRDAVRAAEAEVST